tara:strand:+ start:1016 stop:1684 length:669 start_codon:yes stop_codon:yes gene_type:complete
MSIVLQNCSKDYKNDENLSNSNIELPNDIRWVTNSSEYKILCEQIYYNAWNNISQIINNSNSNSCIVMDLDETVLDNSNYQIDLTEKNESYNPDSWSKWVNLKKAKLVPGAKEFINNIRKTNVKIVFLSNRMAKNEEPTKENMKDLGILHSDDIFLLRRDKKDKKDIRRKEILNGKGRMSKIGSLEVIAYFGDAKHDFPDLDKSYKFGNNMYMFPNPMYGKW